MFPECHITIIYLKDLSNNERHNPCYVVVRILSAPALCYCPETFPVGSANLSTFLIYTDKQKKNITITHVRTIQYMNISE